MPAPAVVGFLLSPTGQALIGGIISEAPELVGKLLGIWHKQGAVSTQEIATFLAGWVPSSSFYQEPGK